MNVCVCVCVCECVIVSQTTTVYVYSELVCDMTTSVRTYVRVHVCVASNMMRDL